VKATVQHKLKLILSSSSDVMAVYAHLSNSCMVNITSGQSC